MNRAVKALIVCPANAATLLLLHPIHISPGAEHVHGGSASPGHSVGTIKTTAPPQGARLVLGVAELVLGRLAAAITARQQARSVGRSTLHHEHARLLRLLPACR